MLRHEAHEGGVVIRGRVEMIVGGTLAKMTDRGRSVVIVDLTRGEMGTRGNAETRAQEAAAGAGILGVKDRVNLDMGDGTLEDSLENRVRVVEAIREYRPTIVLQNNHTISDGEIFLASYSHLEMGRTVGTPSMGWSLSITSKSLLNGASLRLPWTTDKSIDGESLDEFPRYPDITVDNPIGLDWSRSDPQADTAITALLEQIDEER